MRCELRAGSLHLPCVIDGSETPNGVAVRLVEDVRPFWVACGNCCCGASLLTQALHVGPRHGACLLDVTFGG